MKDYPYAQYSYDAALARMLGSTFLSEGSFMPTLEMVLLLCMERNLGVHRDEFNMFRDFEVKHSILGSAN